jgi:hypothetical protein
MKAITQFEFPLSKPVGLAALASFVSLTLIYWVANPIMGFVGGWPIQLAAYAIIPAAVSFIILYRSNWHTETAGVARACSALLVSCAIFGVLLAIFAASACVIMFSSMTLPKGRVR